MLGLNLTHSASVPSADCATERDAVDRSKSVAIHIGRAQHVADGVRCAKPIPDRDRRSDSVANADAVRFPADRP